MLHKNGFIFSLTDAWRYYWLSADRRLTVGSLSVLIANWECIDTKNIRLVQIYLQIVGQKR